VEDVGSWKSSAAQQKGSDNFSCRCSSMLASSRAYE